jgi:tetratricopeptide (TPR) repeat protein
VEPVEGFMVSDRIELLSDRTSLEDYLRPREIAELVLDAERRARESAAELLDRFLPSSSVPEAAPVRELRRSLVRAEAARGAALALWSREAPELMAWYCELPGNVGLRFLPYAAPRMEGVSDRELALYGRIAEEAYRYADEVVADALAAADEATVVLVVSNCGMKSGRQRPRAREVSPEERRATRWRRRYGVLYAWGRGVRAGTVRGADSKDIAPTVLGLLGLPAADDLPGRFLGEAFDASPPEETVASYEGDRLARIRRILCGEAGGEPLGTEGPVLRDHPGATLTLIDPLSRGTHDVRANKNRAALRSFHLARMFRPEDSRIPFSIASLLEVRKRYASATMYYRVAIRRDPDFAAARMRLASVLWKLERRGEALAQAAGAVKAQPALAEARFQLGVLLLESGRVKDGERQLRAAVKLEPDFLGARHRLGIHLLSRGSPEEAAEHFQAAVDLDPEYLRAWNNLGVALLRHAARLEDPRAREAALDRALETLDQAVERFPDYPKPYFNRARLRALRGQEDLAAADARRALDLDVEYEEARRLLEQLGALPSPPR